MKYIYVIIMSECICARVIIVNLNHKKLFIITIFNCLK